MGALVYAPAIDAWGETGDAVNLDRLADGARRVLTGAVEAVISELGRAGGSPGGARPKALITVDEEGRAVQGDAPEDYVPGLVKFASRDDPEDIARVEQAYALMAGSAGVAMPPTRLLPGDGFTSRPAVSTAMARNDATRIRQAACFMPTSAFLLSITVN